MADICKVQHRADCGVGTVWFVRMDDGYLVDCGAEGMASEERAKKLVNALNYEAQAEQLRKSIALPPAPLSSIIGE